MPTQNIVIFASGSGSNTENIVRYFQGHGSIRVAAVFTNRKKAGVLQRMASMGVPTEVFTNDDFTGAAQKVLAQLDVYDADYIVLAGFLRKVPAGIIKAFKDKIINIHPALLPKYGGKGMYGARVHRAVHENGDKASGISVHLVNEVYDDGAIIAQKKCDLHVNDTPKTIESKVRQLEMAHFPAIIESYIEKKESL